VLIDDDSNTETGYRGADYYYLEIIDGKVNAYLYLLSSIGGY